MRLPLLLLAFCTLPLAAQAQTTCATALADGRNAYDDARFEDAARVLERCVDQLPPDDQRAAYRLIALSHLGSGNTEAARAAVRNLLRVAPAYRTDPATDPPPFARLVQDVRAAGPQTGPGEPPVTSAAAGRSNTKGLLVQAGLGYTALTTTLDDESDTEGGAGISLLVGYGFTPSLAVFAVLAGASLAPEEGDNYTHSEAGLGVRYHFGSPRAKVRPYVQLGVVQQTASFTDQDTGAGSTVDFDVTGIAGRLGGGVLYFFSPTIAFHGEVNVSAGEYSDVNVGDESASVKDVFGDAVTTTGAYVRVGITAFPFR